MFELLAPIQSWLQQHENFMLWFGIGSGLVFVLSLLSMPWIVSQIPHDYFLAESRHRVEYKHWLIYLAVMIIKNVVGLILLFIGILMLALPGPGLITIMIGIILLNFPGKFKLEQWLISRPGVLKAINWLRSKRNKPALLINNQS